MTSPATSEGRERTGAGSDRSWPSRDRRALRRAWATYAGVPLGARAFVAARFAIAPLGPLTEELGTLSGRVLSLGSGLCMIERYLAEVNPDIAFDGLDLDAAKVDIIATTGHRSPRVTLTEADATALDDRRGYDGVLACDALHHFPVGRHAALAADIAAALAPGGVCIVKDLDVRPTWKYRWNRAHDRLVAGPEPIFCRSPDDMAAVFGEAGLVTERAERTDRRLEPYAHYLLRLRKPA